MPPPETESVHRPERASGSREATDKDGDRPADGPTSSVPAVAAAPPSVSLRVAWSERGHFKPDNASAFSVAIDRWERLQIPVPSGWQGGGLRLDLGCPFAVVEIVGARVYAAAQPAVVWEKLGREMVSGVRVSPGTQVMSNLIRLRLLCVGEDAQITLPDLDLPSADLPLTFELGLRLRTDLVSIGYSLHAWVEEANSRLEEARARLLIAEQAREDGERRSDTLLAEVELARKDGNQREAALKEQLTSAHESARALTEKLRGEIEALRTDAEQRLGALREQLASAHETARAHSAALQFEIEQARADGQQREHAWRTQLEAAHEASRRHAAALQAEIDAARAFGDQRAAALLTEVELARTDAEQREIAGQTQLAASQQAARTHAAALIAEIEAARAYGEQRAAAISTEMDALRVAAVRQEAALQAQLASAQQEKEQAHAHASALSAELATERAQAGHRIEDLEVQLTAARLAQSEMMLKLSESEAQAIEQLRAAHATAEQVQTLLGHQLTVLRTELAEARRSSDEHSGRVRSMQRSFSWRVTLPWRIFIRAITGRRPARRAS